MTTSRQDQDEISDQELYQSLSRQLGKRHIQSVIGTIAGSPEKPNEDAFVIVQQIESLTAAVFDGTTSLKPVPGLSTTGARFASHFLQAHLPTIKPGTTPQDQIMLLNKELLVASSQFGGTLEDTHSLPASTATIVTIDAPTRVASFAHVGDSFGIVFYRDGHSSVFTDDKNKDFDEQMFSLITNVAKEKHITPRQARNDDRVKRALIEMFIARNNNPAGTGSGLLNGDPNLKQYIHQGKIDLLDVSAILIGCDGLIPPEWSLDTELMRQDMLSTLENEGFREFFKIKHKAEDADPDWHHTRYKHSDDATGILLIFESSES